MTSKIALLKYHNLRKVMLISFATVVLIVYSIAVLSFGWLNHIQTVRASPTTQEQRLQIISELDDDINSGLTEDQDRNTPHHPSTRHGSTTKFDRRRRAFVKPVKIRSQFENAFHDINNEAENFATLLPFQHPDNFRRNDGDAWDLTPEYEFEAFGRRFHMVLRQDAEFVHPDLKITFVSKNSSVQYHLDINPNCYYSGSLMNESASFVTVNLCNGMRGHIRSPDGGTYSIEPVNTSNNSNTIAFDHILKQIESNDETSSVNRNNCGTKTDDDQTYYTNWNIHRAKRSVIIDESGEYTIELLIAVDKKVAEFHGTGLQEFILNLISQVNQIFKDNSIDNSINVVLVKWVQLEDDSTVRDYEHGNTVMLDKFCDWQFKNNDYDDHSPDHHDVAILITRDMICSYDRPECNSFLGLAQLGHICSNDGIKSCGAVKDTGLNTAFTIAHELGHILNIPHDEDPKCVNHRRTNESVKIMTEKSSSNADPWSWSACSRYFISEFLMAGDVDCLRDSPRDSYHKLKASSNHPGKTYSADRQCEMTYGEGWQMYQYGENCSTLWCHNPNAKGYPRSESGPWADGTECGPNHWCRRKKCVPRSQPERVVHGGWSEWQPFSECTRTCGGGVRKSRRLCNSPKNLNGGDYCKGSKVRFESCNSHECPSNTPDFRSQQCAKFNNHSTHWVPHFRQHSERERCILVCKETNTGKVQSFNEYVIDGTSCDKDLNYGVCVNGKCQKTGCDHRLHSNLVFDNCGVCGGTNSSCKLVHKLFDKQSSAGYTFIDLIPAGASFIDIKQYSHNGSLDKNYLALKDPLTGRHILNDDYSLSRFEQELSFEDITIEYGGTMANPECIRTSARLPRALILEILSSSNAPPFEVVCQYVLPMVPADYYKWEPIDEWTNCDKVCNGEQEKIIRCFKKDTGNVISSGSCSELLKPPIERRPCNDFCTLSWRTVGQTECSSPCGQGIRKLTYRCYQENHTNDIIPSSELSDVYCIHLAKPPEEETCLGPCINAHWRYREWEPCSVTCGKGVRKRHATCVDDSDREVDESACTREEKRTESACYMDKCPQWSYGDRSSCSVTCGRGVRKRQIRCEQNNRTVSSDYCRNLPKPVTHESCEMPACAIWIPGEWSQCSVTCGAGSMVRTIRCSASDERECQEQLRPPETQYCFLPACTERNNIASLNHVQLTHEEKQEYQWRNGSWGECSTTCGKGMRQRSVKCYKISSSTIVEDDLCIPNSIPRDKIPPTTEPCEERSCAEWKMSTWNSCSVTCGRGLIKRRVWCEVDGNRVDERECSEMKPVELRICDVSNCPTTTEISSEAVTIPMPSGWRVGRWGECSVRCGGGIKTRSVLCMDSKGGTASDCLDHSRPASSSPCNTNPCADQAKWKYGEWSRCNRTCGAGYQHRQVQCMSINGESMPEAYCGRYEESHSVRPCENRPCSKVTYQWQTSVWSECSVTCGIGVCTRAVRCRKEFEYEPHLTENVIDSFCDVPRPISEKECRKYPCQNVTYSYHWRTSPWSECSATCGSGWQKRRIDCRRINNENVEDVEGVPDHLCDKSIRPPHHKSCQAESCSVNLYWVTGPWGECTGPCGNKKRRRKLYCYRNFENVHRSLCRNLVKPKRRRKCPQQKCEPVTCLDIKQKYHEGNDREYTLNIQGRNISIYCHEMRSSHPKEYLSLNAGTSENYSEYYAKRLRDPDSCPHERLRTTRSSSSKEDNSLASLEEDNSFAGRTVFRKLRLNVTSMQVLMNDYTFATSRGYSIPIGQAGDCYSKRADCAQGTFSINVSGTGLRIASSAQWEAVGSNATMDVKFLHERRKVVGRCGGYCAMCKPIRGLKLDILPP